MQRFDWTLTTLLIKIHDWNIQGEKQVLKWLKNCLQPLWLSKAVGLQTCRFKQEQVKLLHRKTSYGSLLKAHGVLTKYKSVLGRVNGKC